MQRLRLARRRATGFGSGIGILTALVAICWGGTASAAPLVVPQRLAQGLDLQEALLQSPPERLAVPRMQGEDGPPAPEDLAETTEVRLTAGLQSLAEELGGDPTRILAWVRRQVVFTPIWGSAQGSEGCRLSRECGAHDTASLLVALLRAAGIPARYVLGRVTLSEALFSRVMGGFEDSDAAFFLATSGRTPVTPFVDDEGNIVLELEHVWVEAHLTGPGSNTERWVAMEPSLKPVHVERPTDAATEIGLVTDDFIELVAAGVVDASGDSLSGVDGARVAAFLDEAEDRLSAFQASWPEDATVGEALGAVEPRIRRRLFAPERLSLLPPETPAAGLPEVARVVEDRRAELPASDRHTLTLALENGDGAVALSAGWALPELADRRLTLGYLPATQPDADIVEQAGGLFLAPPDQVNVRPHLFLDGERVASGPALPMGTFQRLRLTFTEPSDLSPFPPIDHFVAAGTYAAIGLNLRRTGSDQLQARRERIAAILAVAGDNGEAPLDDVVGEALHSQAQIYFALLDAHARATAHALDVVATRRPAELLMALAPVFRRDETGRAVETRFLSMTMDVQRSIGSFASRTGNGEDAGSYQFGAGAFGSALEHASLEITQGAPSVSTVRLITEAHRQGTPVFAIDLRNRDRVLPQLDVPDGVHDAIIAHVAGGGYAVVPRDPVSFLDWRGTGYMLLTPRTGDGGYLISGGLAGGSTADGAAVPDFGTDWGTSAAIEFTSWEGLVDVVRALEITDNDLRLFEPHFRRLPQLSECARARLRNLQMGALVNRTAWSGLFGSGAVPGITGVTDLRFHVPSLSAFVFEILAEKLEERRREQPLCELDEEGNL